MSHGARVFAADRACFWTLLDLAGGAAGVCTVNFFTHSITALSIKAQSGPRWGGTRHSVHIDVFTYSAGLAAGAEQGD